MSLGEQDHRLWFVVDELDALGHIDGLKDAMARIRKFGGRCVLGFQSIAQVSAVYGPGAAKTIVENCSNSLILRCSASEGGGTAQFASALIGKREIVRQTVSTSTEAHPILSDTVRGHSYGEHHQVEDAVMASEIEALPDRAGFVKFASGAAWNFVKFDYFDIDERAEPFEAVLLGSGFGGAGGGGRWSPDPSLEAWGPAARDRFASGGTGFLLRDELGKTATDLTDLRRFYAELEAMRNGDQPIPESMADALGKGDTTIDEFVEICQTAMENLAGEKATTLAAVMRDTKDGRSTTDYVEMIKRMAAQGREPPGIERG